MQINKKLKIKNKKEKETKIKIENKENWKKLNTDFTKYKEKQHQKVQKTLSLKF